MALYWHKPVTKGIGLRGMDIGLWLNRMPWGTHRKGEASPPPMQGWGGMLRIIFFLYTECLGPSKDLAVAVANEPRKRLCFKNISK